MSHTVDTPEENTFGIARQFSSFTDLDGFIAGDKLGDLLALLGGDVAAGFLGDGEALLVFDLLADLFRHLGALALVHQLTLLLGNLLTLLAVEGGGLVGGLAVHWLTHLLVLCPANFLLLNMTHI